MQRSSSPRRASARRKPRLRLRGIFSSAKWTLFSLPGATCIRALRCLFERSHVGVSARYQRDDFLRVGGLATSFGYLAAAPEHGDAVGHIHDVSDVVADQEHGVAALGEAPRESKHLTCLGDR